MDLQYNLNAGMVISPVLFFLFAFYLLWISIVLGASILFVELLLSISVKNVGIH